MAQAETSTDRRKFTRVLVKSQVVLRKEYDKISSVLDTRLSEFDESLTQNEILEYGAHLKAEFKSLKSASRELLSSLNKDSATQEAIYHINEHRELKLYIQTLIKRVNEILTSYGLEILSVSPVTSARTSSVNLSENDLMNKYLEDVQKNSNANRDNEDDKDSIMIHQHM